MMMRQVWQNLCYSLRALRKNTVFTAVAVLSLALSIGANTAIFTLINALLLRDLPVPHPERLVERSVARQDHKIPFSYPMFRELAHRLGLSHAVPIRVLVVEDFAPFRQFILSTLASRRDLQVIGEVSDGLEAVQKAVELQPDLVLLDIGLPSLNGIEAARQIRKLLPESEIIFLTQESSAEVMQEAFSLGARSYIVKAKAGSELLTAVEAGLLGKTFVSSSNGNR